MIPFLQLEDEVELHIREVFVPIGPKKKETRALMQEAADRKSGRGTFAWCSGLVTLINIT